MPVAGDPAVIDQIGRALFAGIRAQRPVTMSRAWWTGQLMEWAMRDVHFKTDLFRFIDVLPALRSRDSLARHMQEYFDSTRHEAPAAVEQLLARLGRGRLGGVASEQLARQIRRFAQQFIVGEATDQALPKLRKLWGQDQAFSIDILGEACVSEAEARTDQKRYLALIPELAEAVAGWPANARLCETPAGPIPRANVSVKLSSLYPYADAMAWDRSVHELTERLRPIFRVAREAGVAVNVDMEDSAAKDLTIAVFQRLCDDPEFQDWPDAAIALQAYLKSAEADVEAFVAWAVRRGTPVTVRLVKGAYWDAENILARQRGWPVPVWETKPETDAAFERCARILLAAHPHVRCAFATHNIRSLAACLATAEAAGVPRGMTEVQMLYGMGAPVRRSVVEHGERLRLYTPIGELIPGMAYLVRRLLENTSNESFLRQEFTEHVDPAALLRDPAELRVEPETPYAPPPAQWLSEARAPGPFVNTPVTDFTVAANRAAFADALARIRATLPRTVRAYVGTGRRETGPPYESRCPNAPNLVVGQVGACAVDTVEEAVRAAEAALGLWRETPMADRADVLLRAADLLRRRRFDLSALQVYEVGKTWREADADVVEAIDFCEYYGLEALRFGKPGRTQPVAGERNDLLYEPRGVAAVIPPWNFPLAIPTGMTVAALVMGNSVILKPANAGATVASALVDTLYEAGLPPGVLQFLPGWGSTVGAALAAHPDVALIAFTGSQAVGHSLLRTAGTVVEGQLEIKKLICELGGKNALIVDDDADLDEAVKGILHSAFGYQGQKCSACSRVIVVGDAYAPLVGRLVEAVRSLPLGDAADPATHVGAVITEAAQQKVREYIAIGKAEGTLLVEREAPPGYGVGPVLIGDIQPAHRLAQEEVFGPVVAIMHANTFATALLIANGTPYALTGGVYSRSPGHIAQARREFRVGNLYINRGITGAVVARQPFGGFRQSGTGTKAGGPDYLLQFCEPRTITENTLRRGFAPPDIEEA